MARFRHSASAAAHEVISRDRSGSSANATSFENQLTNWMFMKSEDVT